MTIFTNGRPAKRGPFRLAPQGGGRRRAALVVLAIALCATLGGCYAGQGAQTAHETPDTAGVDGAVGTVVLNDVYLETGNTVPIGGSVALRAAFTEESGHADRLVAVSTPVAAAVELLQADGTPATDGIEIPAEGQVDGTTGPVLVRLAGLTRMVSPLEIVPVTFEFESAGRVTIKDVPASPPAGGRG